MKRVLEMAVSTTRSLAESFFAGELEQKLGQHGMDIEGDDRKVILGAEGHSSIKPEETNEEDEDDGEDEEEEDDAMLAVIG